MDIAVEGRTSATNGWSTLVRPKRKMAMSPGVRRTRARLPLPRQSAKRTCSRHASQAGHRWLACLCHAKALYGHVPGRTSYLGHQLLACLGHPKAQNGLDPGEHSTSAPRAGPPWQCQRGLACLSQEKAQTGHVPGRASHKSHYGLASLGMEKAQNGHALGARRTRATKGWPILARLSWPPILARLMRTTDNPLGGRGMRASKVGLPWPGQSAKRT